MLKNETETNKDKSGQRDFTDLIKQIEVEYTLAHEHQRPELKKNLSYLKLYNNQKKNPELVSDVSLFSIMQTVLAALYVNSMNVVFDGNNDGGEDKAENVNDLAKYDHKNMQKHVLDYFWIFDACFLGYGLIGMEEFDREKMIPVPSYIDGMTFLRDPKATSPNGLMNGQGAMRFGGMPIEISKMDLNSKNGYFDYDQISIEDEFDSMVKDAQNERDSASGFENTLNKDLSTKDMGDNILYPALKWYTHYKGDKVKVILANNRTKVIKFEVLGKHNKVKWPIIHRPLFPSSKSWSGTSIPDLIEDKQRHKSVLMNLSLRSVKSELYPIMLYAEGRIKNKADLKRMHERKLIGIKGEGDVRNAAAPLNKATPRMDLVDFILSSLDQSAQIATGSPEMQQGQLSDKSRTLGELNMVQSNVTKRHTLASRIFSWSEEEFWLMWYGLYMKHFHDGIDEKMIKISGAYGNIYKTLTKEEVTFLSDPDVTIEDSNTNDAKNARERILMSNYGNVVFSDPTANHRWFRKKLGKINGLKHDELERLYPLTIDELLAIEENSKLSKNEIVKVSPNDNHEAHIEQHYKALKTKATESHIRGHRIMQQVRKNQPELFDDQDNVNLQQQVDPNNIKANLNTGKEAMPNINLEV